MSAALRERAPRVELGPGGGSSSTPPRRRLFLTAEASPARSQSAAYALILLGWSAHIENGGRLSFDEFVEAREK